MMDSSKKKPRYFFKKELKQELLENRTVASLAKEIGVSYVYLSNVLNGKINCSLIYAKNLWCSVTKFKPLEYYFRKE